MFYARWKVSNMSADLQERMLAAVAEAAQRNAVIASTIAVAEPTELTEFERRALPLITKNVPVVPLRPRTKIAFFDAWQNIATTDAAKIAQWGHDYPDANIASVAKAQPGGVWFLDVDREGFAKQIEQQTGHKMPETFMVRSSASKGHYYFLQSAASIAMGNRQGKGDDGKETFSARVSDRYVVGPNSYHPDGHTYELLKDVAIVEAPQWLIDFCVANDAKTEIKKTEHTENEPVHEGGRNNLLTSIAGKMRQLGKLDKEELYQYLTSQNLKRCVPPLPDSEVRTIANSIGNYAITVAPPVIYQGRNLSEQPAQAAVAAAQIEPAKINSIPYPKFPLAGWIFEGIPAYDKWVKPFCKINSRYPEFMMLPLMVLILNYLSAQQVRIEYKNFPLSIYLLLVGRKGRVIKSSSAQDAMSFCEMMGILRQHGTATRNADGKSLVFTVGSTEGLGSEMTRTVCKGAVLFYDEFSKLIAKMGIENSSFANDLSTMYESGKFANRTKSHKEAFSFEPGTYCTSLIGCTTDKRYPRLASKLFSSVDGMDERFFVLYQPEVLKDVEPMTDVPIPADAVLAAC